MTMAATNAFQNIRATHDYWCLYQTRHMKKYVCVSVHPCVHVCPCMKSYLPRVQPCSQTWRQQLNAPSIICVTSFSLTTGQNKPSARICVHASTRAMSKMSAGVCGLFTPCTPVLLCISCILSKCSRVTALLKSWPCTLAVEHDS